MSNLTVDAYAEKHGLPLINVKGFSVEECQEKANEFIVCYGYKPLGGIVFVETGRPGTVGHERFYYISLYKEVKGL